MAYHTRPSGGIRIRYSRAPQYADLLQTVGKSPADIVRDRKNVPHSYQAYLHVEDPLTGHRKTIEKTFPTKAAAQKWLNAELVTAAEDPLELVSPTEHETPWTVEHLMQEWFRLVVDPSEREESTKANYHYMSQHIIRGLGKVPLMSQTGLAVQSIYGDLLAAGKAQRTVGLTDTVLKAALEQAVERDKVLRNPAAKVHPPKGKVAKQIPQRALSVEQAQVFMEQVRTHRLRNLWLFYLVSGARRGAAPGIAWDDVDWEQNVVHIQRSLNAKRVAGATKTASGRRTIPLAPIMVEALHQQRQLQSQDQIVWPDQWQQRPTPERNYVFLTRYGTLLRPDNVYHYFKQLLKKAGLPATTRLHDLRHTVATHMIAQGVPANVVSELLGHANISITLSMYAHVLPPMGHKAVADWQTLLFGAEEGQGPLGEGSEGSKNMGLGDTKIYPKVPSETSRDAKV